MFIPRAVNDANLICDLHLMGTTLGLMITIRGLTCNMYAYRQNVQNTERVGVLPICGGSNKFQAKADRQRRKFRSRIPRISAVHQPFYISICISTLPIRSRLCLLKVENVLIPSC